METTTTALQIILIVGGCLLLPLLRNLFESHFNRISHLSIIGMFLGSFVSMVGFSLGVSWNYLGASLGQFTAFMVYLTAWLSFLFLSFSAYSTQLNNETAREEQTEEKNNLTFLRNDLMISQKN